MRERLTSFNQTADRWDKEGRGCSTNLRMARGIGEAGDTFQPTRLGSTVNPQADCTPRRFLHGVHPLRVREFSHGLVLAANAPDYVRSTGLHMSDIYNSLYKKLDPKRYNKYNEDGTPEEMNWTKVGAGSAFELQLEPQIETVYGGARPGELFTQHATDCSLYRVPVRSGAVLCHCGAGVAYSPDWLFDVPELILGEFKFTWYSCRNFPHEDKFDKWVCQVQSYLYHLKMLKVWVFPFWVNGKYPQGAPSPEFEKAYELTFTPRELTDNWRGLLRHAWKEKLLP